LSAIDAAVKKRGRLLPELVGAKGAEETYDLRAEVPPPPPPPIALGRARKRGMDLPKPIANPIDVQSAAPASSLSTIALDRSGRRARSEPRGKAKSIGAAAEPRAALRPPARAAKSGEVVFYAKGAATATGFRPWYWSYECQAADELPAAPRERKTPARGAKRLVLRKQGD